MTTHNPLINFKKTYTLVYIYNYDADQMEMTSFTAKEIHEAYKTLPSYRGRVCTHHDLRKRLQEKIETAGRLRFNLPLIKDRHTRDVIRYINCAYKENCWNCQKTLRDDYASYLALSLHKISEQRKDVKDLIGETNQEILFVFDNGPSLENNSLDSLFVDANKTAQT